MVGDDRNEAGEHVLVYGGGQAERDGVDLFDPVPQIDIAVRGVLRKGHVDRLPRRTAVAVDGAVAACQELVKHMAATKEEGTAASAWVAQLAEESRTAHRRISAMRGQLTRAQKDGNAARIAAARERSKEAETDFDRISEACIAEGQQIVQARLERMDTTFALMDESWAASAEAIEAFGGRSTRSRFRPPPVVG